MFKPGLIFVTAPNQQVAQELTQTILAERLAACVSAHAVTSVYRWDGKINTDSEVQLVLKTNIADFERIAARIKAIHPYEVPEIVATPITNGFEPYLAWIKENTVP